jgi:hypothetical protein
MPLFIYLFGKYDGTRHFSNFQSVGPRPLVVPWPPRCSAEKGRLHGFRIASLKIPPDRRLRRSLRDHTVFRTFFRNVFLSLFLSESGYKPPAGFRVSIPGVPGRGAMCGRRRAQGPFRPGSGAPCPPPTSAASCLVSVPIVFVFGR